MPIQNNWYVLNVRRKNSSGPLKPMLQVHDSHGGLGRVTHLKCELEATDTPFEYFISVHKKSIW